MSVINLEAKLRKETGRKTNALRAIGKVPAVVYGIGTEPQKIVIDRVQFVKTYKDAGESSVVELFIDQKTALHVLIQDYQLDPLRDEVIHVDFRSIDMNKEIEADVDLEFIGEAPAVKALGGTFVASRDSVTIKCLPKNLIRKLTVVISVLKTFDNVIRVSDLIVADGVEIMDEPNVMIASVEAPRTEEEIAALEQVVDLDVKAVVVETKEKEEGEKAEGTSTKA